MPSQSSLNKVLLFNKGARGGRGETDGAGFCVTVGWIPDLEE